MEHPLDLNVTVPPHSKKAIRCKSPRDDSLCHLRTRDTSDKKRRARETKLGKVSFDVTRVARGRKKKLAVFAGDNSVHVETKGKWKRDGWHPEIERERC